MEQETTWLCQLSDIEEGQAKGFFLNDDGNDELFIVKHAGQVYGWKNACPHVNDAPMAWRKDAYMDASKQYIVCFAHGALFKPESGLCVRGPCKGKRLEKVTIEIDQTNNVWLVNSNKNKK